MKPLHSLPLFAIIATGLTVFATGASAEIVSADRMAADAAKSVAAGKDPIPGPRTCFWARGPSSGDPYLNIAYPDTATFYWAAVFTIPANAKLTLEGKFPRSRYRLFKFVEEPSVSPPPDRSST